MRTPQGLLVLRAKANRGLVAFLWLHLILIAAIALHTGADLVLPMTLGLVLAGGPTLVWQWRGDRLATHLLVAVALVGMASVLVSGRTGQAWQVDSHVYVVAALPMLAAYCDWRVLAVAAAAAALDDLGLTLLAPSAVYPDGPDLVRVGLHAVAVVFEACVLGWISLQLHAALVRSEDAVSHTAQAQEAAEDAQIAAEEQRVAVEVRMAADRHLTAFTLADDFESTVVDLMQKTSRSAKEVKAGTLELSGLVEETARRVAAIAGASGDTVSGIQTIAGSANELSGSVQAIARHVARGAEVAGIAVSEAARTDQRVQALVRAANQIGDVIGLIASIAEQTNLLALNATIEAARAAGAGLGFSVVASEVKALASQTSNAAAQVKQHIVAIQEESRAAAAAIGGIANTVEELGSITVSVSRAVAEQEAATMEIATSARRAARNSDTVSEHLEALTTASGRAGHAAAGGLLVVDEMAAQFTEMKEATRSFTHLIRGISLDPSSLRSMPNQQSPHANVM